MKRPSFYSWYYDQGIHELLEIWKNSVVFFWQYFSISEMFKTLTYPWHSDVQIHARAGWNPVKSVELFFEKFTSFIFGFIVRLAVAIVGLVFVSLALLAGLSLMIFWISAPLIFAVAFFLAYSKGILPALCVSAFFISWISAAATTYLSSNAPSFLQLGFDQFMRHQVFERICGRLGIARRRFPDEILESDNLMEEFLKSRDLTRKDYLKIARWELGRAEEKRRKEKFWLWENLKAIVPIGLQWRWGFTPELNRYCQDLSRFDSSEYANCQLVGRHEEYEILKRLLERKDRNCALVVGGAGIGKSTLIHELARRIRRREKRGILKNSRIMVLDLEKAISDAVKKGEDVENFMRVLFSESAYAGNVILVLENLEKFLDKSAGVSHPDISAVLSEALEIPSFRVIATASVEEYHQLVKKHGNIAKYFETIEMREPTEDEALEILLLQMEKYEVGRVLFTYQALQSVVVESKKNNGSAYLPACALDLAMDALMFWEKKSEEQFVSEAVITEYVSHEL